MKRWSKKEDNYLIKNYSKMHIDNMCRFLNRSRMAIYLRRQRLLKNGETIKDKKDFLSKYWKDQYRYNKTLIRNHKLAIQKIFQNESIQNFRKLKIKEKFKDIKFREKFIKDFIKRRNSTSFKTKQSKVASEFMKQIHSDPIKHKKLLENLRKNPSNQQLFVINLLKNIYGANNVGCCDWNILDGRMEVDIPIYSLKTAIEWDGEYWHSHIAGVKERDSKKNKKLIKKGWKVIRILARSCPPLSNKEIQNQFEKILSAITSTRQLIFLKIN